MQNQIATSSMDDKSILGKSKIRLKKDSLPSQGEQVKFWFTEELEGYSEKNRNFFIYNILLGKVERILSWIKWVIKNWIR